ncbi:PREDICTED: ER membrane protein complex subunit 10-like [Priapulus caudatus]|uniref:ER membrane protein complex subunit 10 n=1 Tax=Priapulus caudatus TaxID=37621 RepID=A0ABM1EW05_PRICU|nr:PREDICTED: ER membrane protein complex subunit 10-like [Priapulus caudatus]
MLIQTNVLRRFFIEMKFAVCLHFLLFVAAKAGDFDSDFDGGYTLSVEHAFGAGGEFSSRGTVTVKSVKSGFAVFTQDRPLNHEEIEKLRHAAESDGFYMIRIPTKPELYVSTFIKACSLYESELSDVIRIHLDQTGDVIGVSLTTVPALCQGLEPPDSNLTNFNTSVEVAQTVTGPTPDTSTYLQKMAKDKEQKVAGEQDNRSFFAKYWMYIVPVVVFMLITSASDQGSGGGGGAR